MALESIKTACSYTAPQLEQARPSRLSLKLQSLTIPSGKAVAETLKALYLRVQGYFCIILLLSDKVRLSSEGRILRVPPRSEYFCP
jgi:hypothetical protein